MSSIRAWSSNLLYGPLIGRRDLTREQWNDITRRMNKASLKPTIVMIVTCILPIVLWQIAVLSLFRTPTVTPNMTAAQISAIIATTVRRQYWIIFFSFAAIFCGPVLSFYLHRRLAAPYIRAAANELGLANVCVQCGHNHTGLSSASTKCPECGTEIPRH